MRRRALPAGLVVLLGLLTACARNDGVTVASVSGTLRMTGGPAGATTSGVVGQVAFTSAEVRALAQTAADGTFTASLAPGTYTVTGTSPQYADGEGVCRADEPLVVSDDDVEGLVVACSRK
jgi:hypothetical protein